MFPDFVLAWGRLAHAGLLTWRLTPATAMNMLTHAAKIAADRSLGNHTVAAQIAVSYATKLREQMFRCAFEGTFASASVRRTGRLSKYKNNIGDKGVICIG